MKYFSAGTTYPNTPESDRQTHVWHTVTALGEDGKKYQTNVMATDPQAAIDRAQYQAPELWEEVPA